jgi:hypothetical protein
MPVSENFTEAQAQKIADAFKRLFFGLTAVNDFADLLMAHIRQTTKLRADLASTRPRQHSASGTMAASAATASGTGSVVTAQNNPPVWQTVPGIVFTEGAAANFSVSGLVSDPENDTITITHNGATLPTGVTFDSANKRFVYDGSAGVAVTTGHQLTADDGADDTLVQFGLNSTSTGTAKPFCFLHSFKRGDVPLGRDIVASIPDFQAAVTNRWPDGSVKHALIAGHADLTANVTRLIDIKTGTANAGTALTEAQMIATGIGSDTFALPPYGTVTLSGVLGRLSSGYGSPGLLRTRISGPEMSEFHYYSPVGSDAFLSLFFYVRYFKGGAVEIEVSVENGYLKLAGPGARSYTPTFTINGTNRTGSIGALDHKTRTKWGEVYYRGTDPVVRPVHDVAYLRATGLVPNYGYTQPAAAALTGHLSTNVPFQLGSMEADMGAGGDAPSIGLLPKWEALHCTAASVNTYIATIYNGYAMGRYSIYLRDETTMRPPKFSDHPNLTYDGAGMSNPGTSSERTPTPTGGTNGVWDVAHFPSWGYMPYLLTGRWNYLETLQHAACTNAFRNYPSERQFSDMIITSTGGAYQTRGAAWSLRSLIQALCVTPDGDALQTEFANSFAANMAYYAGHYVNSANTLGFIMQYENYSRNQGFTTYAPWQDHFFTAVIGWGKDMGLPLSTAGEANHNAFLAWKTKTGPTLTGTVGVNQYCYRRAGQYNLRMADSESFGSIANYNAAVYADPGILYSKNFGANTDCQLSANLLDTMHVAAYSLNFLIALSAAVDAGTPGALAGYQRLTAAPNFIALTTPQTGLHNDPRYGVLPRSV